MRSLLLLLTVIGISVGISSSALAVCQQVGNTPDGGNIIDCPPPPQNTRLDLVSVPNTTDFADEVNVPAGGGINFDGASALFTGEGDDIVRTSGEYMVSNGSAISTVNGNDTVIVDGGTINSTNVNAITMGNDDDTLIVNAGLLNGGLRAVNMGSGADKITINGGTLISRDEILINMGSQSDMVTLNGGTYEGEYTEVINLGSSDDMLIIGADLELNGIVECGLDFDTIVFAMDVPIERLNFFTNEILTANPSDGSVEINGITYEWINCEQLVPELNGVSSIRPIPTLSQWGLIAMAGLVGMAGLFVMRRRAAV